MMIKHGRTHTHTHHTHLFNQLNKQPKYNGFK